MTQNEYRFWKAPMNGMPEYTSGGNGVSVNPGFGQWVLLHPRPDGKWPEGSVPVDEVIKFLEQFGQIPL